MTPVAPDLPITPVLGEVVEALHDRGTAVLQAPPGAGKTTAVPLALLQSGTVAGRIVMLEPRRVAARAAAERLAALLGQKPGAAVGYRMRGASVPGRDIEVVTDGILLRMLQSDPELSGISCVIFDEFHERALQADLGLALCLEVRDALRADLRLLVMSATLDAAPVAALMDGAPVITAQGQSFEVETRWRARPLGPGTLIGSRFSAAVAEQVTVAAAETSGDVLVFLPGAGEIAQVSARLDPKALGGPTGLVAKVLPLHGRLPPPQQRMALARAKPGERHLVLATSIAETSLTLPGVRVVVDGGRSRRARYDPTSGMSHLVTDRVSRAEAAQRRGRAGRVAPGICYRLWTKGEEGALAAFAPAEIEVADLVPMALELAAWGTASPEDLKLLTPPNPGHFAAARALLTDLGALDQAGRLTNPGRAMAALPLHPRLARMLLKAGQAAAPLAALLDHGAQREGADLTAHLRALNAPEASRPAGAWVGPVREATRRLQKLAPKSTPAPTPGVMATYAYPDRVALRRPGTQPRYLLSGGKGAILDASEDLTAHRLMVACDVDGAGREARIRSGLPITEAELRDVFAAQITSHEVCRWSTRHGRIEAVVEERFGALVLNSQAWPHPPSDAVVAALLDGVRDKGLTTLNWTPAAQALCKRAEWLRGRNITVADMSAAALEAELEEWLGPFLPGTDSFETLRTLDLVPALTARLGADGRAALDRHAPPRFMAPTGTGVRIDYGGAAPSIEIRLQEMFGLRDHPKIADGLPLLVTLLSPAGRPVQSTSDLPGFWRSSYADVRRDMRGRYPRHPWPEDPLSAAPTRKAKPKGR